MCVLVIVYVILLVFICWYVIKFNLPHDSGIPKPTATPKPSIIINDEVVELDVQDLQIVCDPAKKLGIAYFVVTKGEGLSDARTKYAYSPSGILSGSDYDKFCGDVK